MGKYDPVAYQPISTEPNTFGRPRQKMWGVFLANYYNQSNGTQVGINFTVNDKFKSVSGEKYTWSEDDTGKQVKLDTDAEIDFATINDSITQKPESGPAGETIFKYTTVRRYGAPIKKQNYSSNDGYSNVYDAKDIINGKEFWYYYEQVYTTKWTLIKLTSNIQEAKSLVNDWLRMPEISTTSRPYAGISSIMITEIVPADSVIEL